MSTYTYKLADPTDDYQDALGLLYAIKEDLHLANKEACAKIIDVCFEKGGIVLGYDEQTVVSLGGFFWGDPTEAYRDSSVGFVYVAAILPEYRLSRVFFVGLRFLLQTLKQLGAGQVRMQARKGDPYTNRLYSRFARPLGEGKSLRGDAVLTYGNEIEAALTYFEGRRPQVASETAVA
ncbi:MAG: hypothetical protein KDE51_18750 [Anaerolineales bacterium]|nr:hypothetical protein [Anaerolineales bacterium]